MALGTSWTQIASQGFTYLGYSGTAYVYAKLNRQDIANNKSYVDLELRIYHSVWVSSYDTDFYLSGYGWLGYAYRSFDAGTTTIMSSQITVNHNADGTGSFTATGGYEYGGIGVSASTFTSSSQSLPTIARASKPTASPNPLTIGSSGATLTVTTNRKASSFMHTVKVQCGSWSWTSTARSVGASVNVTIPYTVIAQFSATSKTATATVTCTTFSGTTQIGSAQTCSVTFQVNASVDHANVGTITVQDTNARTSAVTQDNSIYIANISTLEATIPLTVSGSYTELAQAVVTCGNKSQTYTLSGTSASLTFEFDKVNASSLTVTVKDKRGNSVTGTKSWTLIAYQPVTAVATVGRPSATGSVGVGQLTGMAYGGNFGGKNLLQNAITMYGWGAGSGANITGGVATLNGTTSNWNASLRTPKYPASLYDGSTTYTLSYDYKSTASCSIQVTIAGSDKAVSDPAVNRTKYVGWGTETVPSSGGTWARRTLSSRTIAVSQLTSGSGEVVSGFLQFYARTDNVQFQIRNVQLEKGSTATSFSSSENVLTVAVDFKKHDDPDYDPLGTETDTLALSQDGYNSYTDALTFAYTLDYQYQYDIRFTVSDLFSTATYVAQLMQGLPIISWDETEVDVFGNLHIHDRDNPTVWQDVMQGFDGVLAHGGQKNLLPITASTATKNGVTFTVNGDGTVKANGTASATTNFDWNFTVPTTGEYILSGCPANGSAQSYEQWVWNNNTSSSIGMDDFGDGATQTLEAGVSYNMNLRIASGYTANNIVFRPMIRDARIASDEYVPNGFIVVQDWASSSKSISANGTGYTDINIAKTGFTPLGIVGFDTSSTGLTVISCRIVSGTTTARMWVKNTTSSAQNLVFVAYVLYMRNM